MSTDITITVTVPDGTAVTVGGPPTSTVASVDEVDAPQDVGLPDGAVDEESDAPSDVGGGGAVAVGSTADDDFDIPLPLEELGLVGNGGAAGASSTRDVPLSIEAGTMDAYASEMPDKPTDVGKPGTG